MSGSGTSSGTTRNGARWARGGDTRVWSSHHSAPTASGSRAPSRASSGTGAGGRQLLGEQGEATRHRVVVLGTRPSTAHGRDVRDTGRPSARLRRDPVDNGPDGRACGRFVVRVAEVQSPSSRPVARRSRRAGRHPRRRWVRPAAPGRARGAAVHHRADGRGRRAAVRRARQPAGAALAGGGRQPGLHPRRARPPTGSSPTSCWPPPSGSGSAIAIMMLLRLPAPPGRRLRPARGDGDPGHRPAGPGLRARCRSRSTPWRCCWSRSLSTTSPGGSYPHRPPVPAAEPGGDRAARRPDRRRRRGHAPARAAARRPARRRRRARPRRRDPRPRPPARVAPGLGGDEPRRRRGAAVRVDLPRPRRSSCSAG